MALPWAEAVKAGVVTDAESDLFRECVQHLGRYHWRMDTTGLDQSQLDRLAKAIAWFCSLGGVH